MMKEIRNIIDPVDIYNRFLDIKQEETQSVRNKQNKKKYSASGAGMCKHKHWFDYNGYSKGKSKPQDIRKMRLGTILGQDFDKAMAWFEKESLEAQIPDNNVKIYSEMAVSHNILKINDKLIKANSVIKINNKVVSRGEFTFIRIKNKKLNVK